MTLYTIALTKFAHVYIAVENWLISMAVRFNLDELITGVNKAKEAAMLQNMEMLISNLNVCKTYQHLKACKDMYQMLCLSYPEFHVKYGAVITKAISRKEQSFNN